MSGKALLVNPSISKDRQQADDPSERSTNIKLKNARLAIIDDEDDVREALAFQLSTAGFNVTAHRSPYELISATDAPEVACIVADIFMPELNGLELLEKLRETRSPVPVILITGHGQLSIGVRAIKAGAFDAFQKPVDEETLLSAVKQAIALSFERRKKSNRRAMLERRFIALPPRQREVFFLLTAGLSNKQVGAELLISERTVKAHRESLRRNLGIDSLAELSRLAEFLQSSPARSCSRA
jgi:FixJ family two-component response regulator